MKDRTMDETAPIPFFRFVPTDAECDAVTAVMRSGWLTTGREALALEAEFSEFIGDSAIQSVAVNSCTAGLHLVLEALGIGPGDEVIVPTMTFTATAEIVTYCGATPVFADMDPDTLCVSPQAVRKAITPRTRAIIIVHFAGLAADIDAFRAIADEQGIALVEDAAHALPTGYRGGLVGSHGTTATVFSFYANKTITTGEGGMITTRDPAIAARCRVMRTHGIDRDAFGRFSGKSRQWEYDVVAGGFKYNLTDMAAALGRLQLARAMELWQARSDIAAFYREALAGLPLVLPPEAPADGRHSWHIYPIQLSDPAAREGLMTAFDEARIGYSVHYKPLHLMTFWRDTYRLNAQDFPAANSYFDGCITLPLYPTMTLEQAERVASTVRRQLEGRAA